MEHPGDRRASKASVAALVTAALLAHNVPEIGEAQIRAAEDYVDASIAAMPDITRAGVRMASGVTYLALSVIGRSPYRRQSTIQRSRNAARLASLPVPVLGEYSRLTRGLGLVKTFELRTPGEESQ